MLEEKKLVVPPLGGQSSEPPKGGTTNLLEQRLERMPTVSRDTVYRTLASLEEMGLVSRADPVCGRARYDANCDTHHHFICKECGSISDVYLNEEPPLPEGIENLGSAESLHLQIRGVCHNCKKN